MATPSGSQLLAFLTLVTGIALILFLGFVAYSYRLMKKGRSSKGVKELWIYIRKHAIFWAWMFAIAATLGSLYYSEILGYNPCTLCWYQRILMYPFVLLLGIAWFKKDHAFGTYAVPISIIGAIIAAYHYATQRMAAIAKLASCGATTGADCTVPYTFQYGYITIPMMALTAFVWIAILTYLAKKTNT